MVTHVKDVRQEPMGSGEIPAHLRKQDSITGFGLRFQLVSGDSWTWVQCLNTVIVSEAAVAEFREFWILEVSVEFKKY